MSLAASVPAREVGPRWRRRGLPRSRTSLFPPSQRQPRGRFPCWASPTSVGSPACAADSRSLSFQAGVWSGPFTAKPHDRRLSFPIGGATCARVLRRDLNPLATCAARRTEVGLRRLLTSDREQPTLAAPCGDPYESAEADFVLWLL